MSEVRVECKERNVILVVPDSLSILTRRHIRKTSVDTVEFLPNSTLKQIAAKTFGNCWNLRSLCIPASVVSIGLFCFAPLTGKGSMLQKLTFEKGSKLQQIGKSAFYGCSQLTSICFPAALSQIDGATFRGSHFTSIQFEAENEHFCVQGHFVLDFKKVYIVHYFGQEETVQIPDQIEAIGSDSFSLRTSIDSLSFGSQSHLRSIDDSAFEVCSNLRVMCIPSTVTAIDAWAFAQCYFLISVTFEAHSQLVVIGANAFVDCHNLGIGPGSLCLPSSLEYVGERCFELCKSLSRLNFEAPSHLRVLRSLPTVSLSSIEIPDSVEILESTIDGRSWGLTTTFGQESKLTHIKFSPCKTRDGCAVLPIRAWIQIPASRLKAVRDNAEFDRQ